MSQLEPIHYGLIAAVVIAIIFIILFFVSLKQRKNSLAKVQEQHKKQNESLKSEHKEKLDHERVENKKVLSKQKEEHQVEISQKEREIDSLKIFSKNEGEYITDRHLLDLRDQLVNERRIRPEDMHIMANIFLPKDPLGKVHQIDHIVLTRTGIYVIDSNLVNGHIYHGITEQQFSEFPVLGQVFETLDLNPKKNKLYSLKNKLVKNQLHFMIILIKLKKWTKHLKNYKDNSNLNIRQHQSSISILMKWMKPQLVITHKIQILKCLLVNNNYNISSINLYSMEDSNTVLKI